MEMRLAPLRINVATLHDSIGGVALVPLSELALQLVHPILNKTICELLGALR